MIAGSVGNGSRDRDTKYITDLATAVDSARGVTAYTNTLPYWVEPNTTDQATARGVMATASLVTLPVRAEPKHSRLVTPDNKTKQARNMAEVEPLGLALAAVQQGAAPRVASAKGGEVGTSHPKPSVLHGVKPSVLSRQLKRVEEWRAIGNNLSSWLRADKGPGSSVAPLANPFTDRQPLGLVPTDTNLVGGTTTRHTVNTSCGGGPGQTRYDYSDKRWLEGRWREEKDIEGPGQFCRYR